MFSTKFSDDEDDLFAAKPSQHLANLFNTPMQPTQDEALPSLKYVAPKQSVIKNENDPVQTQQQQPVSVAQNTVLLAKRVTAYKYTADKQYAVHGVLGLALVEITKARFKIILYKDKQNIISSNNFINDTKVTVQDRYCYYTDDLHRSWAVLFENEKDLQDFLAKIKNTDIELIMTNDKKQSESNKNMSDTSSDSKKSVEASNASDDRRATSGAEEKPDIKDTKAKILSLMEKMGQTKLLPEIGSGGASTTLDNTTDSSDTEGSPNKPSSRETVVKMSKPLIKPRKLDSSRGVGQIKSTPINTTTTTSIVNVPQYALINGQLVPIIQTPPQSHGNITSSSAICLPSSQIDLQNNQHLISASNNTNMLSGSSSNDNLNLYLCENRIHNSELRMNVSRLEQKLDRVLDEIKDMGRGDNMTKNTSTNNTCAGSGTSSGLPDEILHCIRQQEKRQMMEIDLLKTKLKNFEDHFRDDRNRTRSETSNKTTIDVIADYENKIETLELKLRDYECCYDDDGKQQTTPVLSRKHKEAAATETQQKLAEYEQEIDVLKSKLQDYETAKQQSATEIRSNKLAERDRLLFTQNTNEIQMQKQQETIEALQKQLADENHERELLPTTLRSEIKQLQEQLHDTLGEKNALHDTNRDLTERIQALDTIQMELREKLRECETKLKESQSVSENNDVVLNQRIKDIMNGVFGKLSESFPVSDRERHHSGEEILKICKQAIRTVTLECLKTTKDESKTTKDDDNGVMMMRNDDIESPPPIPPDFDV